DRRAGRAGRGAGELGKPPVPRSDGPLRGPARLASRVTRSARRLDRLSDSPRWSGVDAKCLGPTELDAATDRRPMKSAPRGPIQRAATRYRGGRPTTTGSAAGHLGEQVDE